MLISPVLPAGLAGRENFFPATGVNVVFRGKIKMVLLACLRTFALWKRP